MFSKLQSHYFIETHPSCSLYPTVLVPWGASTTLGEAVGVSPDGICLESAMTGRSSQCSLIFQLGISKARRESSKLCWMFSTQSPLVELTGSAGSLFPSVSESHLRNICFSSQTITNIQSCISAALNEGITPQRTQYRIPVLLKMCQNFIHKSLVPTKVSGKMTLTCWVCAGALNLVHFRITLRKPFFFYF